MQLIKYKVIHRYYTTYYRQNNNLIEKDQTYVN